MLDCDLNNLYLFINLFIWAFSFIIYQCKVQYFGVGSGILVLYMLIAVLDIHLYNNQLYLYQFRELEVFPFLYLFLMIILIAAPIFIINEKNVKKIDPPSMSLFRVTCVIIIIFSLIGLPRIILTIRENFVYLILNSDAGLELYQDSSLEYTSKVKSEFNIFSILSGVCGKLSLVYLFYYITLDKQNKFILLGLILSSISGPLYSISSGSRAETAQFLLNSIFLFLFVRNMVPEKLKKKILTVFFVLSITFLIPFLAITLSRKDGDVGKALTGVENYIAQGPLYFNNYGLDAGGIRYGDYTAVAFKYMAGMNPAMYYWGRLSKYSHMKLNESLFYTFVGDFTLDYGPVWTMIIFLLVAFIFIISFSKIKYSITFHQYLMLYLLMTTCLGYFQFPFGREGGNLYLISIIILYFVFRSSCKFKKDVL